MTSFPFPYRAEDLPANSFWFRSGTDGWDFRAERLTPNGWDVNKGPPSSPVANKDRVCYGMPVYAIADGEVISSWRNAPENPRPGVNHPGRIAVPKTIPRSGNHVLVLGDDGSVILYAHHTTGSVPIELCPFNGAFVTDADDKVAPRERPTLRSLERRCCPPATGHA